MDTMMQKRKLLTGLLICAAGLLLVLGIIYLIFQNFVCSVILKSYIRFLLTGCIFIFFYKAFQKQIIPEKLRKTMTFCAMILFIDLCVVETIRYALSGGISTVLFLPACLPLCFLVIMHSLENSAATQRKDLLKVSYWVGIPLLILSVYFEIMAFLSV